MACGSGGVNFGGERSGRDDGLASGDRWGEYTETRGSAALQQARDQCLLLLATGDGSRWMPMPEFNTGARCPAMDSCSGGGLVRRRLLQMGGRAECAETGVVKAHARAA